MSLDSTPRSALLALPDSEALSLETRVGRLALHRARRGTHGSRPEPMRPTPPPVLLVHSINAAACAAEMLPVFARIHTDAPVYALDLPGYGASERAERVYDIDTFVEAVRAATEHLDRVHEGQGVDLLALSLSCEFAARVAVRCPDRVRSLGLISPTGLDRRSDSLRGLEGASREVPGVLATLSLPGLRQALFALLVSRPSMRYFLQRTWGNKQIDEGLLEACWHSAHQPGAVHAPLSFLSGRLFARDIRTVYEALRCPVWLVHGTRGDFRDYSGADWTAQRPNWRRTVFEAGALPHFEHSEAFTSAYSGFLESLGPVCAPIC